MAPSRKIAARGVRFVDLTLDHRDLHRQPPDAAFAGDSVPRLDPAVAVGVDVEVDFAGRHLIEDDRHPDRPGAAVTELRIPLAAAAVTHHLLDVVRLLAQQLSARNGGCSKASPGGGSTYRQSPAAAGRRRPKQGQWRSAHPEVTRADRFPCRWF